MIFFINRILWSESSAGHLFYPASSRAFHYILWDDCALILKSVQRRAYVWAPGTDAAVDLSFPYPETFGGDSWVLESSLDGTIWTVVQLNGSPVTTTFDNFSLEFNQNAYYRVVLQGGSRDGQPTNAVFADYPFDDVFFTSWSMSQSMFISGIMAPRIGFGMQVAVTVQDTLEGDDLSSRVQYQWYRLDPLNYNLTALVGETGDTYITTAADAGYQHVCVATLDGMDGMLSIVSDIIPVYANEGMASDVDATGFTLSFYYAIPGLTLDVFQISGSDADWNNVTLTPTGLVSLDGGVGAVWRVEMAIPPETATIWVDAMDDLWALFSEAPWGDLMQGLTIELTAETKSYDTWVSDNGLTGNDALGDADPGQHGMCNFFKYLAGLTAYQVPLPSERPGMEIVTNEGVPYLCMDFIRDPAIGDISIQLRGCGDLFSWNDQTGAEEVLQTLPDGRERVRITSTQPIAVGSPAFTRLMLDQVLE